MADRDVNSIVWGETSGLGKDSSESARARLQAVVAKLAAAAKRRGQDDQLRKLPAPRADESENLAAYTVTTATANAVEADTWRSDTPLPARAVLWEVTDRGVPRRDRPLPESAAWIFAPNVVSGGEFAAGEGADRRVYRLFESEQAPAENELPYVSAYTGSGVPVVVPVRRWYKNVNWWIGLGGAAVFFFAMFSIQWTAGSVGQAYDLLVGRQPAQLKAFAESVRLPECAAGASTLGCLSPAAKLPEGNDPKLKAERDQALQLRQTELATMGDTCVKRLKDWGDAIKTPRTLEQRVDDLNCHRVLGESVVFASRHLMVQADGWIGRTLQTIGRALYSWHVPRAAAPLVSLGVPITLMMAGVVLVLIALGRGFTGKPLGILMTPEGRYSLALAQVTFWTVLVLTSLAAMSVFNAGLVSEHLRELSATDAANISIFPTIPTEIWAVLGITFASPVLSSIIKGLKPPEGKTPELQVSSERTGVSFLSSHTSGIAHSDPAKASIADWFLGEEGANKDKLDISRVQMVLVTSGLLMTYGNEIFAYTRDIMPAAMMAAIGQPSALLMMLPPVGGTMAVLLAMSHATYLVAKASDKPSEGQPR